MKNNLLVIMLVLSVVMDSIRVSAQQDECSKGILRLPYGVNGTLEVCPPLATHAPHLERQLAELKNAIAKQQGAVHDLNRLVGALNSVSRHLPLETKLSLAQNLSMRLGNASNSSGVHIEHVALKLLSRDVHDLAALVQDKLSNRGTSGPAQTELNGRAGNLIAQLKFFEASQNLKDIRSQLNTIGLEVKTVHQQTSDIASQTVGIAKRLERQQADLAIQKRKDEEARRRIAVRAFEERYHNPEMFADITADNERAFNNDPRQLSFSIMSLRIPEVGAMLQPKMRLLLKKDRQAPRLFELHLQEVLGPIGKWSVPIDGVDESSAVVCFSMVDPDLGNVRRVIQRFTVSVQDDGFVWRPYFVPTEALKFSEDNEHSCDDGYFE